MSQTTVKFLNLWQMRFPVTAVASILHRLTGVVIFLLLPLLMFVALFSVSSATHYQQVVHELHQPIGSVLRIALLATVSYHVFAGGRHLLMDIGIGERYKIGVVSAWLVITLSVMVTLIGGIYG